MNNSLEYNTEATTEDFEFSALSDAHNYRAAIVKEFSPYLKGKVIEIGAGIGQMTESFRSIKDINLLQCVEPDERFYKRLKKTFPDQSLIEGTIQDVSSLDWDAIVSINVLEHIENDMEELKIYARLLKQKKGKLCLFVPARPEIYSHLDKDFGHYRRYVKKDLKEKLKHAGFNIISINYYNSVGYLAWWVSFCLLRKRKFNNKSIIFYDKVIFPVVHFFESRILRPFIGQSLIVIATPNV